MEEHIDSNREDMFSESVNEVKNRLDLMCDEVESGMANKADDVYQAMSRDYLSVMGGSKLPDGQAMPRWERKLRGDVLQVIEGRDDIVFKVRNEKQKAAEAEAKRLAEEGRLEAERIAANEKREKEEAKALKKKKADEAKAAKQKAKDDEIAKKKAEEEKAQEESAAENKSKDGSVDLMSAAGDAATAEVGSLKEALEAEEKSAGTSPKVTATSAEDDDDIMDLN